MSHMFEVGLEGQTVNFQSLALLDGSSPLTNLVHAASDHSVCSGGFVFEDEGDVFQCGRCKRQFSSLAVFMHHKREGCALSSSTSLSLGKEEGLDIESNKPEHEMHTGHYITEDGHLLDENVSENERHFESMSGTVLSSLSISQDQQGEENVHEVTEDDQRGLVGSTSVIHMTPSLVLGDEQGTLSFTIPVDQNSTLAQLLAGSNSSTVLSIPENELAALIHAGERYHISSADQTHSMNSHFYLTASILPANVKEPLSEKNISADSSEYIGVCEDHMDISSTLCNFKKESLLNNSDVELVTRFTKAVVPGDEVTVIRMRKEADPSNRENTQLLSQKQRLSKASAASEGRCSNSQPDALSSETGSDCKRKCEYCGKPFKKLFNLHQHIRSHTGEKPFHCLVCGRGFTQKSNVKKHMSTHKVWPKIRMTLPREQISVKVKDGNENLRLDNTSGEPKTAENVEYIVNNVYVCQYCDQHFENYHKLKTHLSHTHKNEKLFKCIHKDCVATFMEVEGLICHMKSHEDQIEYQCQNCPKKFKNLYDLGAHQYSHRLHPNKVTTSPPKQFRCTKCNSKYASAEALNHHLLTSSHNYPCSQCQLTFVCERYLRRHLRIHGTIEPFKCDLCGKMFKTENYLKSHLVIHSDSKPFHCEICKQSFNRRDKLTRHKLMHDNRKKYKCPFKSTGCEREFYRKDKLKDHMMSHSRKVYVCSKCGKTFSWPVRLRKHQATHHPEMLLSTTCPTCHKIFKTKHHLKIHACKGPNALVMNNLEADDEQNDDMEIIQEQEISSEDVMVGGEPVSKVVVLYDDCEISDSINDCGEERCETGIMLGSFSHAEDPESVIFTRYSSSECGDKEVCHDLEGNEDGVMGPIEMTFETGVEGHMDQLITAD